MGAAASLPVIICGMAGSRQGWIEAPYVATPAHFDEILAGAIAVPGQRDATSASCPGVAQRDRERPDVMRGEETQLAGIASLHGADLLVCMPGTHSKWVSVADGAIAGFATWLTGELFSVLSTHSILRHSLGEIPRRSSPDNPVFQQWLRRRRWRTAAMPSRACSASAPRHCCSTCSRTLRLRALSGLLIGNEIASARRNSRAPAPTSCWSLPARSALSTPKHSTLAGLRRTPADADEAVRTGLFEAARRNFGLDAGAEGQGMSAPFPKLKRGIVAILRGLTPDEALAVGRGRVRGRHRGDRGAAEFARSVPLDRDASSPTCPRARWSAPARC